MKRLAFLLMTGIIWPACICGCSVKEDRKDCPCRLFVDMTAVDMAVMSPLSLYVSSGGEQVYGSVLKSENSENPCVVEVPRGELVVSAWSGGDSLVSHEGMTIPIGSDCPRVYLHSSSMVADGDYVCDTVLLRKNHCVLTMFFSETEEPYALMIRGNVAGYDATGKPVKGVFQVPVSVDPTMAIPTQVCLPRQTGDELHLDVTDRSGNLRTFPLHEYIRQMGYDWTEPDLKDLKLTLNYTMTAVTLVIQGWNEEFVFDIVI